MRQEWRWGDRQGEAIGQLSLWGRDEDGLCFDCHLVQRRGATGVGNCSCQRKPTCYARMRARRDTWLNQEAQRQEQKEQEGQKRRDALRLALEASWRERDRWYAQRSKHLCRTCHQLLPASAFGGECDASGFQPHGRCNTCSAALHERKQLSCCLCRKKMEHQEFLSQWNEYCLRGCGIGISLCCQPCESAFLVLPAQQQRALIKECCQRTFPFGQVIYAEVDPETQEIRYIGRTSKPESRHREHLRTISSVPALWGAEQKAWYSRRNWMQELMSRGCEPSMQILQVIEVSPLVVEWEQRYIWYVLTIVR